VQDADPAAALRRFVGNASWARWEAPLDAEVVGDAATKAAMQKAWANRRNWPDGMRRYVASLYEAEPDAWERVASFLDATRTAARRLDRPAPP
jgi:hypothetical protein